MVGTIIGVVFSLIVVYGGAFELFRWLRARRRLRRVPGVIIGTVNDSPAPATRRRAGRFRFTTEDGRVITSVSSASTPRGPRVGKQVTIEYDPARPYDADIAGVKTLKLVLSPVLIIGGLALAYYIAFVGGS